LAIRQATWFRYGEVFSVLLRIVAMLAPIVYRPAADAKSFNVHWRSPVTAILQERADHMSLVVFVLFMLSSTTYDGIHQTIFWMGLFWNRLLLLLQPLWGTDLPACVTGDAGKVVRRLSARGPRAVAIFIWRSISAFSDWSRLLREQRFRCSLAGIRVLGVRSHSSTTWRITTRCS
jgi:hypothetical protein